MYASLGMTVPDVIALMATTVGRIGTGMPLILLLPLALVLLPLPISLLGFGTERRWHTYTAHATVICLAVWGPDRHFSHWEYTFNVALPLSVCALTGGMLAAEVAAWKRGG